MRCFLSVYLVGGWLCGHFDGRFNSLQQLPGGFGGGAVALLAGGKCKSQDRAVQGFQRGRGWPSPTSDL